MFVKAFTVGLLLVHFISSGSTSSLPTISSKIKRQSIDDYPPCMMPDGQHGRCKPIQTCQSINAHVGDQNPVKARFVWHSECGFQGEEPKVCCPLSTRDTSLDENSQFVKTDLLASREECGISSYSKIFRGNVTELGEFPWMAALEYEMHSKRSGNTFIDVRCGGTLISKRYVVTAAHCVEPRLRSVRLGEHNLRTNPDCDKDGDCAPKYLSVDVVERVVFKTYKKNQYHDIALLRLKEEVEFSDFIKPVCLPTTVKDVYRSYRGENNVIVAGWGLTETEKYSKVLLKANVPIVSSTKYFDYDEGLILAGGQEGTGACFADSGGPLMIEGRVMGDTRWFAIGVVSNGPDPCAQADQPTTFARISKYMTWIEDTIRP
ncbi:hypothetical protein Zmor_019285 [Zophobas morio]|uniref:CLIP domain-containing serine protease n=1 Tax=Zophobas morio TaxID=2755281 RepID=A0AA38M8J7_9CUCU|nr:hypothetical protein Zmor_019285 [Zophobas morio]